MSSVITVKTYNEPPFCEKEILRYAGCKNADNEILTLMHSCIAEVRDTLTYKVCFREFNISVTDNICDFGVFKFRSQQLASNLAGCKSVIIFGATVGVGIDRLIAKYGRISPARALMLQAVGAERIEALCDAFCEDWQKEKGAFLKPRFSPGYGDLPLSAQKDIFSVLDCEKRIGLFLNDSFLMSPSKSVTAFVGITDRKPEKPDKCTSCNKKDCYFRSIV